MTIVSAERITKTFGDVVALRNVQLQIREGERVLFIGHNGSGKTTLLNCLAALARPDFGKLVFLPDSQLSARDALIRYRSLISYAGHRSFLYGPLTVEENLRLFGSLSLQSFDRERLDDLSSMLKLPRSLFGRPVNCCSEGERRKVSLVRALLKSPKLLFLDEPTTALDPESRTMLYQVLDRLTAEGAALAAASHDPEFAACKWDRTLIMRAGVCSEGEA